MIVCTIFMTYCFHMISSYLNFDLLDKLNFIFCMNHHQSLVNYAASKIKDEDIIHRAFLKPFEIALKSPKTQAGSRQKHNAASLPLGLKIAAKESINNNKYDLVNVDILEESSRWMQIKGNSQDNFLSLFKCPDGIELAICVCMYSQDAKMLKQTLAGVAENISNIVQRENISSDKIGVFVIVDGIDKINSTVVDYFEELQRRNNINLGSNTIPALSMDQMLRRSTMTHDEINQQELSNVNNFLFDVAELADRNERRFASVYNQFDEIRQLQKTINQIKKGKIKRDQLPNKLQPFLINQLRHQYKKDYCLDETQILKFSDDKLISQYQNDSIKIKPILVKVLNEGERYCSQFVKSRDDLAYLAYFRNKIRHNQAKQQNDSQYKDEEEQDELKKDRNTTNMNLFLCVKYKNAGKLSSHNWFINGFCKELRPRYSVLLDVGLRPEAQSLFKMYAYMKKYPSVGGVCGYMSLKIEMLEEKEALDEDEIDLLTLISMKFVDIQRTQQVEYHFAHLLDKPFEAAFNFIHVLPGAFSAYNMNAILDYEKDDDELLKSYFKSVEDKIQTTEIKQSRLSLPSIILRTFLPDMINGCCVDIHPESDEQMLYNENIYLAEDRILCMGIFKKGYNLAYLPDAFANVDPIKTLHNLLGQRKRWINGSIFAFQKVKKQLSQHQKTNRCQFFLHLQVLYLTLMNALLYFAPSFFLFTVHIAMEAFRDDVLVNVLNGTVSDPTHSQFYNAFVYTIDFIYVVLMLSIVFFSLHLKSNAKKFKSFLYGVSTVLGIFSISVFIVLLIDVLRGLIDQSAFLVQNKAFINDIPGGMNVINSLRWILVGSMGIYILPIFIYILLFGKFNILMEIILGAFSMLFYSPTYLNILYIYSLCRIDDISWGTKGLDSDGSKMNEKLSTSWRSLKYLHVGKYVAWNIVVSVILLSFGSSYTPRIFITIIIVAIMGFSQSIKVLLGIFYMIKYKIQTCLCCKTEKTDISPEASRIKQIVDLYRQDLMRDVIENLKDIEEEYFGGQMHKIPGGSFIQVSRSKKIVEKCFQKKKVDFQSRSAIMRKKKDKYLPNMPIISEQKQSKAKYQTPPRNRQLCDSMAQIIEQESSAGSVPGLSPLKLLPTQKKEKKFQKKR